MGACRSAVATSRQFGAGGTSTSVALPISFSSAMAPDSSRTESTMSRKEWSAHSSNSGESPTSEYSMFLNRLPSSLPSRLHTPARVHGTSSNSSTVMRANNSKSINSERSSDYNSD